MDYRVSYDQGQGTNTFVVLASGITEEAYIATGLTSGVTYIFKVQARNIKGFSAYSSEISILAAQTPDKPDAPVTSVSGSNVIIDWAAPADNGSPIVSYNILIRLTNGDFVEDTTNCDGSLQSIKDAR